MLLVPIYLAPSPIHGIGVFAKEPIAKDTRVWEFHIQLDRRLTPEEFYSLPAFGQIWVKNYGYFDQEQKDFWYLPLGEAAFINHHEQPNIIPGPIGEHCDYAAHDIAAGEELLANYHRYYLPNDEQPWLDALALQ